MTLLYQQCLLLLDKRGVLWLMTQADTPFVRKPFKKCITTNKYKNELVIKNYSKKCPYVVSKNEASLSKYSESL